MEALIPIYVESRLVGRCTVIGARRFAEAPNAEILRRRKTGQIVQINLSSVGDDSESKRERHGNPLKYTFLETVGASEDCPCGGVEDCPRCGGYGEIRATVGHTHSLKPNIANPRNWPLFRAALVDCLPADKQAEIRELFKTKVA